MKTGKTITPLQALQWFGCMRLAARIRDLRDDGHDIAAVWYHTPDKKVKRYSLLR
jgi:hypothetical protein